MEPIPILHIYEQLFEHGESYIVGNREGLEKLRNMIDQKLKKDSFFVSDGEGYDVYIIENDSKFGGDFYNKLLLPYSDENSKDKREDSIKPWDIIKEDLKNEKNS